MMQHAQPMMMPQQQPMMMMQQPQPMMQQAQPMMQQAQGPRPGKGSIPVEDHAPPVPLSGNVHVLITGLDYSCDTQSWAGKQPLDTKYAFDMMTDLAQKSGVTSLTQLWNQQCTKENMIGAIQQVGQRCGPGDTFVFYYTGHGDLLQGRGEMDSCLCTVDAYGNADDAAMRLREQVWLRDDAIAEAIQQSVRPGAK